MHWCHLESQSAKLEWGKVCVCVCVWGGGSQKAVGWGRVNTEEYNGYKLWASDRYANGE